MKTLADSRLQEFLDLVRLGAETWVKAGRLLCRIQDDNPQAVPLLLELNPDLTRDVLEKFMAMGKRTLHPSLVLDDSPAAKRLALLPYDQQEQLLRAKVRVVVRTADGPMEREKRVCDLTKGEAERVIGETGLRTMAEQRRLLKPSHRQNIAPTRPDREDAPDTHVLEVEAVVTESLDASPLAELKRHLTLVNTYLLEARSSLVQVNKREHPLDRHITAALREVGLLRLAVNEGEI